MVNIWSISLEMTVEKRRTWVERHVEWPWTNHPIGSTKNNIKEVNGWYWRDVVIFNETLNNDVTVYWGYSKPHRVLG